MIQCQNDRIFFYLVFYHFKVKFFHLRLSLLSKLRYSGSSHRLKMAEKQCIGTLTPLNIVYSYLSRPPLLCGQLGPEIRNVNQTRTTALWLFPSFNQSGFSLSLYFCVGIAPQLDHRNTSWWRRSYPAVVSFSAS